MEQMQSRSRKRNIILALGSACLCAAVMAWVGLSGAERSWMYGSILIMIIVIAAFYAGFEKGSPHARTVVLIAVMITLAVCGRAAFFWIPQFKPIIAIVIIGGVAMGAQSGFVIGSMSAFVSNFIFGQGPWTAFQMVAWGLIGMIAGLIFNRYYMGNSQIDSEEMAETVSDELSGSESAKQRSILPLVIYGAVSCFVIHGGITDMWTALSISDHPTLGTLLTVYGTGLIADAVLAAATVVFLLALTRPMLKKIGRVQMKYGMYEM